jgi:hypothetical protein
VEIHALFKRGWSISAIARHTRRDRKTVRAYLQGKKPARERPPSCIEPYRDYLIARFTDDHHVLATVLYRELVTLGFDRSYQTLVRELRRLKLRHEGRHLPRLSPSTEGRCRVRNRLPDPLLVALSTGVDTGPGPGRPRPLLRHRRRRAAPRGRHGRLARRRRAAVVAARLAVPGRASGRAHGRPQGAGQLRGQPLQRAARAARADGRETGASPAGARSSRTRRSPPPSSTAYFTGRRWSTSTARATGCGPTARRSRSYGREPQGVGSLRDR